MDLQETIGEEQADEKLDPFVIPFLACGDLSGWSSTGQHLDADASYPIDISEYLPPVSPPISSSARHFTTNPLPPSFFLTE